MKYILNVRPLKSAQENSWIYFIRIIRIESNACKTQDSVVAQVTSHKASGEPGCVIRICQTKQAFFMTGCGRSVILRTSIDETEGIRS